jgi:hypothetical protein
MAGGLPPAGRINDDVAVDDGGRAGGRDDASVGGRGGDADYRDDGAGGRGDDDAAPARAAWSLRRRN